MGRPKGLARANGRTRGGHAPRDAEDSRGPGGAGDARNPEACFRELVEQVPAVVYVGSPDQGLSYIAPQVEGMLGYPVERWFAEPRLWARCVHPGDRARVYAEVTQARAAGKPFRTEYRMVAGDGRAVWVRDDAAPVPGVGGATRDLWRGVMVDVTGAKEAERSLRESEKLFRVTFDQAAAGMAHVAPDGTWLRVNDELCAIVGYPREELLGLTFQDITHPDDLDKDLRQVERLLEGRIGSYRIEKRYLRKGGRRIWVDLSVSLIRQDLPGEPVCFVSVVKDTTEKKLKELTPEPLAPKELEVLGLIAEGKTNPEIAEALSYSQGTIKLRVQRILVKLGVPNRAAASDRAIEIGLLPPPAGSPG